MLLYLFVLFTIVPLVELSLLIWIGGQTAWWVPIVGVVLTGIAGAALARWQGWRALQRIQDDMRAGRIPAGAVIDGVLINILNPKLSIFFVAFLPQFIPAGEPAPLLRMLELSGVFMAVTFIVFALYGAFAAAMRDHVITRPAVMRWLRRTFAAAFVALGLRLAVEER